MRERLLLIESAPSAQGIVPPRREVWESLEDDNPNPEWVEWWDKIDANTVEHGTRSPRGSVPQAKTILDTGAKAYRDTERAEHAATQAIEDAKKVVVTVDDSVMPATTREIKLQGIANEAAKASVKARVAAQEGVTPAQVRVETLDEHAARLASE